MYSRNSSVKINLKKLLGEREGGGRGRSSIYTKNRSGTSTVACETPDVTAAGENVFLYRTTC